MGGVGGNKGWVAQSIQADVLPPRDVSDHGRVYGHASDRYSGNGFLFVGKMLGEASFKLAETIGFTAAG